MAQDVSDGPYKRSGFGGHPVDCNWPQIPLWVLRASEASERKSDHPAEAALRSSDFVVIVAGSSDCSDSRGTAITDITMLLVAVSGIEDDVADSRTFRSDVVV